MLIAERIEYDSLSFGHGWRIILAHPREQRFVHSNFSQNHDAYFVSFTFIAIRNQTFILHKKHYFDLTIGFFRPPPPYLSN
jgi:hypothetical protein